MVLGAMDSICTSSRVVVVACNAVYTPLLQYVKYKLYLFGNMRLPAVVQTSSERSIYWLGTGTRSSLKAREADGHAAQTLGTHRRGPCPGAGSYGQWHPRASRRPRARWHCAAARFGTPWQRWRKAGLRLRAEIGGRGTVPEGLRTGARPAPGCSGRAPWTRGIGGVTEVGRSSLGGGQDRNESQHSRPARGSRRRARSPAAASRWRQPMRLLKDSYACWELSSTAADQSKG